MYKIMMLYVAFFKIGMFSFGGGYAMLPLIEREIIEKNHWMNYSEFLDLLAISQSSPGPIATNSATFIGFKLLGLPGSIAATAAVVSFSIITLGICSPLIEKHKNSKFLTRLFGVLRPLTIGFILSAAISIFKRGDFDTASLLIMAFSFFFIQFKKIHPIPVILFFGFTGIILKGAL